ncbi:MAG: hypothetical protein ACLFR1_16165 [Spirochaetia bacterium]
MKRWTEYTKDEYQNAAENRNEIIDKAIKYLGYSDRVQAIQEVSRESAVVTLLAGSGSRWVKSIQAAREAGEKVDFDLDKPRGLFPVKNLLASVPGDSIPIAAYSLSAVKGIGEHLIMTSGYEDEIEEEILKPLGFNKQQYSFQQQELFQGKPLGHGAAALQTKAFWEKKKYVVFNFGGDANSRCTIEDSLIMLAALDAAGENADLVMPAAWVENPAYTIETNENGLPVGFVHAKLTGKAGKVSEGWSNVGVRLYRTGGLAQALEDLHSKYWDPELGYQVPGNAGNELALDNADAWLAERKRVRLFTIAQPQEITPAKTLDAIPAYLQAVKEILAR